MSIQPQISVVIPTYNAERFVGATIESILAQTVPDIEIIVVDDCSRDGTARVVQSLAARDPRVRYERTPTNCGGPAGPRNLGVRLAKAEWVAFCDSDDLWAPHKLEFQLDAAQRDDGALYCTNLVDFQDGETPVIPSPPPKPVRLERFGFISLIFKNRIAASSVLCRRQAIIDAGGFDENRDFIAVEDYDMWLRLCERTGRPAVRVEAPLLLYRRVAGSISANKSRMVKKMLRVMRKTHARRGAMWALYPMAPIYIATHAGGSIWLRFIRGRI